MTNDLIELVEPATKISNSQFKLLIAGSRTFDCTNDNIEFIAQLLEPYLFNRVLSKYPFPTEIVSGGADGIDKLGEGIARLYEIPLKIFDADWKLYGKRAGPMRNIEMAKYCDIGVIIWDGYSKGTVHMMNALLKENKPCLRLGLSLHYGFN